MPDTVTVPIPLWSDVRQTILSATHLVVAARNDDDTEADWKRLSDDLDRCQAAARSVPLPGHSSSGRHPAVAPLDAAAVRTLITGTLAFHLPNLSPKHQVGLLSSLQDDLSDLLIRIDPVMEVARGR